MSEQGCLSRSQLTEVANKATPYSGPLWNHVQVCNSCLVRLAAVVKLRMDAEEAGQRLQAMGPPRVQRSN